MKDFFRERRPHNGWTYDEYLDKWKRLADTPLSEAESKSERKRLHYYKYNLERSRQVHDQYEPSEALRAAMTAMDEPQLWMVLTEPWCGDSAYSLPVIAEAAQLSDQARLRILPRDDNLDIMDQYLTEGGRRIPKLVAFDEDGHELFQWGARPEEARALRKRLIADEVASREVTNQLLAWYDDGGWAQVDDELTEALRGIRQTA